MSPLQLMCSLFPGLPCFSVLRFVLTIIHGCGRAAKNREGLVLFITCFMSSGCWGGVPQLQISLKTADKFV